MVKRQQDLTSSINEDINPVARLRPSAAAERGSETRLVSTAKIVFKRGFDLIAAVFMLPLALPLMLFIVLLVKVDSPGPAIFADRRIGQRGREFNCYKFRTMHRQSDAILERHLQDNPQSQKEWEQYAKLKNNDPRVTRSGRWLRKSSLDELPQIINVLKGEMSLVGPRPYLPREISAMGPWADTIWLVYPGITGLWQVSGRNEIDFAGRLELDARYVRQQSLGLDISILIRTIPVLINQKGAC